MSQTPVMDERGWSNLMRAISDQRCTPFLGAEALFGTVPSGSDIAREWAAQYGYPFEDVHSLPRVAQFIATDLGDPMSPDSLLRQRLKDLPPPNFQEVDEPHAALADLPLPVYITTNYYDFMLKALKSAPRYKDATRVLCQWRGAAVPPGSPSLVPGLSPTVAAPIVYHVYGHISEPESLCITEDDYLDFLANTSRDPELIPQVIQAAFAANALLFLGYRLDDLDFRVLLRRLVGQLKINPRKHVSVQLVASSSADPAFLERVKQYVGGYCSELKIGVYSGTSRQFVAELKQRWEAFQTAKAAGTSSTPAGPPLRAAGVQP